MNFVKAWRNVFIMVASAAVGRGGVQFLPITQRVFFAIGVLLVLPCLQAVAGVTVAANQMTQVSLTSAKTYDDPFNGVELDVLVTAPDGSQQRVPAFWAGGSKWCFRYSAAHPGIYRWTSVCSKPDDVGLHGVQGSLEIVPYRGENPLYLHGPIRVAADRKHFEYADGTPFFWLADTWWMGLCGRLHWPDDFQKLTADRSAKGFTVVQIVAGLYPDMPAFDPRGANEAGFPWTKDYSRIEPAYFDAADRRIAWLVDHGIAPCIVGAWGYHLPWLGVEKMKQHWRYLVARYGAYPTFWCVAGEGAMPWYLSKDKTKDAAEQKTGWTQVAAYLRSIDPYHHPISIHSTDRSRTNVTDPAVLDFEMLQTGHSDRRSIPRTLELLKASRADQPAMPTVNAEVTYEGILGTCPAPVVRFMAWTSLLSDTAGHTYGANGIWQVNTAEQPYGKSPHGGNWGNTPWEEAMNLPGSTQVGLAKKLLTRFAWQHFESRPEWAAYADSPPAPVWGNWIWYPEGDPAHDAPIGHRFFRRTFQLPAPATIESATLSLAVDDRSVVYVNGQRVGASRGWNVPERFDVGGLLRPGTNVLAIDAENVAADVPANPAGLVCGLRINLRDGEPVNIGSDEQWRCSKPDGLAAAPWTAVDYDDAGWAGAKIAAQYGKGTWGLLPSSSRFGPFTAGIARLVRVVYVPTPDRIRLRALEPDVHFEAEICDPASGTTTRLGPIRADQDGTWLSPRPPLGLSDWVLVVRASGAQ